MPSKSHEDIVNDLCSSHGFINHSFMFFVKYMYLSSLMRQEKPEYVFGVLVDSPSKKGKLMIKIKDELEKEVRQRNTGDDYDNYVSLVPEALPYVELDSLEAKDQVSRSISYIDKMTRFTPDCWRFKGGQIEIIEVTDTSKVSWRKLTKCALIYDILFYSTGIHAALKEIRTSDGSAIFHNLILPFSVEFDTGGSDDWLDCENDEQMLRLYYKNADFELSRAF